MDYVGNIDIFAREFEQDICVIDFAVKKFGLPAGLKLSIHSGSDKFSLYGPVNEILQRHDTGVHLKTAGTTWLEELVGLALAGSDGLTIARDMYKNSLERAKELCAPYASVIDINSQNLPTLETVNSWTGEQFAQALRHEQNCPRYNPDFRQLLHVGYKVAAAMGERYLGALRKHEKIVGKQVVANIFERHIAPLFLGTKN